MKRTEFDMYNQLNKYFMFVHEHEKCVDQLEYFKKYGDSEQESIAKIKLETYQDAREKIFSMFKRNIQSVNHVMNKVYDLDELKKSLADQINKIYNQNGTFDDFFDGFKIKYEPYNQEVKRLDEELWDYDASAELLKLHYDYMNYLFMHVDEIMLSSCDKISDVLYKFFDDKGKKGETFAISTDPDVFVVDEEQLRQLLLYISQKDEKYKIMHKQLKKDARKVKKEGREAIENKIKVIEDKLENISNLDFTTRMLQNRINAQQKGDQSIRFRIRSDVMDMRNKIYYATKKRPNNWTFVTNEEIEYIEYLVNNIDKDASMLSEFFGDFEKQTEDSIIFPEFGF